MKQQKFHGSTSWAVFHQKFKTVADHDGWAACEKATHLLAVLQSTFYTVSYLERQKWTSLGGLKGRYGDHQLAAAYRPQLEARTQLSGESLQELGWIGDGSRGKDMPSHHHHLGICDHRQA